MRRQVGGWIERYQRVRTSEVAELDPLTAWLSAEIPDSPTPTVIHNDYKRGCGRRGAELMPHAGGCATERRDHLAATSAAKLTACQK
jgi:hypothetical protein